MSSALIKSLYNDHEDSASSSSVPSRYRKSKTRRNKREENRIYVCRTEVQQYIDDSDEFEENGKKKQRSV